MNKCSEWVKRGFESDEKDLRSHSFTSAPSLLNPLCPVASKGISLSESSTSHEVMKLVPIFASTAGLNGLYLTSHNLRVKSSLPSKNKLGLSGTHFIAVTTFRSIFLVCSCFWVSMSHNLVV